MQSTWSRTGSVGKAQISGSTHDHSMTSVQPGVGLGGATLVPICQGQVGDVTREHVSQKFVRNPQERATVCGGGIMKKEGGRTLMVRSPLRGVDENIIWGQLCVELVLVCSRERISEPSHLELASLAGRRNRSQALALGEW